MNMSIPFASWNWVVILAGFSLTSLNGLASSLTPTGLRCEYLTNPTAIDETQPRLSWIVEVGKNRGILQSAYQILAASDVESLNKGHGDIWDSGKISSDQS